MGGASIGHSTAYVGPYMPLHTLIGPLCPVSPLQPASQPLIRSRVNEQHRRALSIRSFIHTMGRRLYTSTRPNYRVRQPRGDPHPPPPPRGGDGGILLPPAPRGGSRSSRGGFVPLLLFFFNNFSYF